MNIFNLKSFQIFLITTTLKINYIFSLGDIQMHEVNYILKKKNRQIKSRQFNIISFKGIYTT